MKKVLAIEIVVILLLLVASVFVRFGVSDAQAGEASLSDQTQPSQTETVPEPTQTETVPPETTVPTDPPETLPEQIQVSETFAQDLNLAASQYFVYDIDRAEFILLSGEETDKVYPASITKLFTVYVALQYVDPEEEIEAGDAMDLVAWDSSIANIQRGDVLTAQMLVEGMLLPSGNDAAHVLTVYVGRKLAGDESIEPAQASQVFMDEMNRQAQELGMTGSHFVTPDGIHDEQHYFSIADLALVGTLAVQNETIMTYAGTASDSVELASGTVLAWQNTNKLIQPESEYYSPYALGLKTGYTSAAGNCLMSVFCYEGRQVLIGVFGCPSRSERFSDTLALFHGIMQVEEVIEDQPLDDAA